MAKAKNSQDIEINKALQEGGIVYVKGVRVFVDNPNNFSVVAHPTGFWIRNAMGFHTYFQTTTREKAQEACNELFGSGRYTVNSKV